MQRCSASGLLQWVTSDKTHIEHNVSAVTLSPTCQATRVSVAQGQFRTLMIYTPPPSGETKTQAVGLFFYAKCRLRPSFGLSVNWWSLCKSDCNRRAN
jgi:hypothetical protein